MCIKYYKVRAILIILIFLLVSTGQSQATQKGAPYPPHKYMAEASASSSVELPRHISHSPCGPEMKRWKIHLSAVLAAA